MSFLLGTADRAFFERWIGLPRCLQEARMCWHDESKLSKNYAVWASVQRVQRGVKVSWLSWWDMHQKQQSSKSTWETAWESAWWSILWHLPAFRSRRWAINHAGLQACFPRQLHSPHSVQEVAFAENDVWFPQLSVMQRADDFPKPTPSDRATLQLAYR